ncbi:MAG: thioredoxin domain-containing protein [Patescibacteria group bacterium]|nr:thioredoxin domain-containing protein [Patescibacteria group bacterium]
MKSSSVLPLAIVLGGMIIAGAVYLSIVQKRSQATIDTGNAALVRPVSVNDHILGNPAASVLIVEYTDFDCEFCKSFDETLRQIIANEGADGRVSWVLREFPLTEIHPNAMKHARAAECVAKTAGNDAFWKFTHSLFANQPVNPLNYGALAEAAGVQGDAFAACYSNAAANVDARIDADRQNAFAIGARGTPYSLILVAGAAPVVMDGAYSYDAVKSLVDQALAH